ncbi:MAG TPA: VWA domain-containing protein [Gaiellaceae bacterium]|nr:VWA domain-containing protein [Gaiellaceae bacterium]
MRFEAPELLVFLLVVPAVVVIAVWLERHRAERATAWAPAGLLANMVPRLSGWKRFLPLGLLLAGLTLLLVGFARPQATLHVKRQDATVVVVLDVSGSMAAKDAPPTRLGAAVAAADRLVDKLPKGYRMAVVTFSDHAAVVQAPTDDKNAIKAVLAKARAQVQGTAIADGVARGVAVAKSVGGRVGEHHPAVVVLFSDGGQTAGSVTPQQATQAARKAHIPVSAVSVGTPDGVVEQKLRGGYTEQIQVPVQPATLQQIATGTGGRFYAHVLDFNPDATYQELGSRVGKQPKRVEVTAAAAAGGLMFMLAGGLLSGLWFRRMP